jgi:16S rRNA (guanine966-N2)-methyltransferase
LVYDLPVAGDFVRDLGLINQQQVTLAMRVIAGAHRGRKLIAPEGAETTRPITDRVKQSLFDRLSAAGAVEGAVVLDLFSGTGSMGIECLSRGAAHVTFVERDRGARRKLEENLNTLRETERSRVLGADALGVLLATAVGRTDYTLVFCDPPYRFMTEMPERVYGQIARLSGLCGDDAALVLRTPAGTLVPTVDGWRGPDTHSYGSMVLHHFVRTTATAE